MWSENTFEGKDVGCRAIGGERMEPPKLLAVEHRAHGWLGLLVDYPGDAHGLARLVLSLPDRSPLAIPDVVGRTVRAGLTPVDLPGCPARWCVLVTSDAVHVEHLRHAGWGARIPQRIATYRRAT